MAPRGKDKTKRVRRKKTDAEKEATRKKKEAARKIEQNRDKKQASVASFFIASNAPTNDDTILELEDIQYAGADDSDETVNITGDGVVTGDFLGRRGCRMC